MNRVTVVLTTVELFILWFAGRANAMDILAPLPSELEELSRALVDSAFKVHQALGPGLLESVYEDCLRIELKKRGIAYQAQAPIPPCL